MPSMLEQLKRHSTVVADTGDIEAIKRFQPADATTNPSIILKALQSGHYSEQLAVALSWASENATPAEIVNTACDRLTVLMGLEILKQVPGKVSTEVPASLSFDTCATVERGSHLFAQYRESGVSADRILIKVAATWEGIQAARVLESKGIHCNLTLVFNQAQARACAEAGVYLISPFVGRILDWHVKAAGHNNFNAENDPGVLSVCDIYRYFKQHNYPTVVMAASFRNIGEVLALSGCDRLTISPALLEQLAQQDAQVNAVLADNHPRLPRPSVLTEEQFRWALNQDAMATEKLAEGIRQFHVDHLKLAALVAKALH